MGAQDLIALINSGLLQSDRIVKLDTPAGPNVLLPHIVVGAARLGGNFEITVDVVSLQDSIELKSLIAQPVTLWIQQPDKTYRPRHGYVSSMLHLGYLIAQDGNVRGNYLGSGFDLRTDTYGAIRANRGLSGLQSFRGAFECSGSRDEELKRRFAHAAHFTSLAAGMPKRLFEKDWMLFA